MAVYVYPDLDDISFKNANKLIEGTAVFREAHDYLKITVIESNSTQSYSNYTNRSGGYGVGNKTTNFEKILGTIFLYMPQQLSESFQAGYNTDSLGMLGASAMRMANQRGDTASMAASLKDAANGLKPEVGMSALASAISGVAQATGAAGGQVSTNTIGQLTRGKILNPYKELIYQGVDFRSHQFSFKLTVNNQEDISVIQNILRLLKVAMHPGLSGADKDEVFGATTENKEGTNNKDAAKPQSSNPKANTPDKPGAAPKASKSPGGLGLDAETTGERWLTIPDFFKLELVRVTKDAASVESKNAATRLNTLVSFPVYCVLEGMTINYTPDGSYQPLKERDGDTTRDLGVLSYQLDLQFRETGMITKQNL